MCKAILWLWVLRLSTLAEIGLTSLLVHKPPTNTKNVHFALDN